MHILNSIFTLTAKDLLLEIRTRAGITFIISLSLVLSVVLALGVNSAFLDSGHIQKLFPSLIWIVFFLTSTIVLGKSYDSELENKALDGFILAGIPAPSLYLSKVISNFFISILGHAVSVLTLALLLDISLYQYWWKLLILSVMVLIAFSALSCLTVYISSSSKAKSLMLPLILLPLLLPCYFTALELSYGIFLSGTLDFSSPWISLLISIDVVYIALGVNLFPYLVGAE
jgi:heme exporter protein B